MGECPLDGPVRNSHRSADLFPRRTHGRGHRAEKGDGGRAGSGGDSLLLCCGNSGCRVGMAHRCEHYRNGRWRQALRFPTRRILLDRGVRDIVHTAAVEPKETRMNG